MRNRVSTFRRSGMRPSTLTHPSCPEHRSLRPFAGLLTILLFLPTSGVLGQPATEFERQLIESVSADSLLTTVRKLSGELPVTVGGIVDTIDSRYDTEPGNELAADWIEQKLRSYAFDVSRQSFSYADTDSGVNILGTLAGQSPGAPVVMLTAHYDAVAGAPGADDNASGTAGVLEAARLLSDMWLDRTIIFAFWDAEERGLIGSKAYVSEVLAPDDTLHGVINLDMIAWDGDDDGVFEIHSNVSTLTNLLQGLPSELGLALTPVVAESPTTLSDHASFWTENPAALLIEEILTVPTDERNPNYHQPTDVVDSLDVDFFREMVRLATVAVVRLAADKSAVDVHFEMPGMEAPGLVVYPNPVRQKLTIAFTATAARSVMLDVYDVWGRRLVSRPLRSVPVGRSSTTLDVSGWAPGLYSIRLGGAGAKASPATFVVR